MDILCNFDQSKYFLGNLCSNQHDFEDTGKSIRYKCNNHCVDCCTRNRPYLWKRESFELDFSDFDRTKYYLGRLCPQNHDWNSTGLSLRDVKSNCIECHKFQTTKSRTKRRREKVELSCALGRNGAKYFLGNLCRNEHDWDGTGQSMRYVGGHCVLCVRTDL